MRLTASYEPDLRTIHRWLGHHRVAGYLAREESFTGFQGADSRIINSDTTYGTDVTNTLNNANRNPTVPRLREQPARPCDWRHLQH